MADTSNTFMTGAQDAAFENIPPATDVHDLAALKINHVQAVGPQQTGTPGAAVDLASSLTLLNFLRTALLAHGLIA